MRLVHGDGADRLRVFVEDRLETDAGIVFQTPPPAAPT